jgi:UDP-glucose 4-epimerase
MNQQNTSETMLVTGGAGFIGSHVVDALVDRGHRVIVVDDLSSGRRENVHPQAELHVLDIRSSEAAQLIDVFKPAVVFHLAAQMDVRRSTEDPAFDASINVLGTLNLLAATAKAGVRQFIFASTGGAIYGEQDVHPAPEGHPERPVSPYGVSKLAGERYMYYFHVQYGLDVTCLRFANVYGERQNPHGEAGVVAIFLKLLNDGKQPVINGDGLQTRDYIHVSDVVRANMAAIGRAGFHTYNVGTGIESTVVDLYQGIRTAAGSEIDATHGPAKPGEQRRSSIDATKIRRALGLPEPIGLAVGLKVTSDWFRDHLGG